MSSIEVEHSIKKTLLRFVGLSREANQEWLPSALITSIPYGSSVVAELKLFLECATLGGSGTIQYTPNNGVTWVSIGSVDGTDYFQYTADILVWDGTTLNFRIIGADINILRGIVHL